MKVSIVNQYCENRGDEAAGEALVTNLLRLDNTERIDIIYNSAYRLNIDHSRVIHHNEDLRLKLIGKRGILQYLLFRKTPFSQLSFANDAMKRMAGIIKDSDVVFVTPCGASIGIYKDWPFLIRLLFVLFEGKTPVFHLNTIGASGDLLFDIIADYVLRRSKIYVREKKSQEYLKAKGIDSELGIDTAFSLDKPVVETKAKVLGFVPSMLSWHPAFAGRDTDQEVIEKLIPELVDICRKHDFSIEIIPHLATDQEHEFHLKVKEKIDSLLGDNTHAIIRRDVKTAADYDKAIASCCCVVGMRYHSIVLSAKNHVPFLALAYENKMIEVCQYTDSSDFLIDIQKDDNSYWKVQNMLEYLIDNRATIVKRLRASVNSEKIALSRLPLVEVLEE